MTRSVRLSLLLACASAGGLAVLLGPSLGAQILKGHDTGAPVDFAADHIEVQDRADRVVVSGHVVVTQAGLTMTAARLTVAYHNASGIEIDRLDASGGVTVTRGNERASGDVAIYDLNRKLITLVGHVQLSQGANRLTGSRLVIDLTSGRSTVDGGSAPSDVSGSATGRVTGTFQVHKSDQK